ncbi:hypothetical protein ACWGH2_29215 [Streptomyces sp. NPDC054871]
MIRIIRTTTLYRLRSESAVTAQAQQEAADRTTEAQDWRARYDEARTQRDQDKTATDQQLAEIHAEVQRIRVAADDPDAGKDVRAAIALGFLTDLYADARNRGMDTRPLDLVAIICGFPGAELPQAETASAA